MRYELADQEWAAIKPMLPNKPRSRARVDDRRVLNGILGPAIRRPVARSIAGVWPLYGVHQHLHCSEQRTIDG